ncbi:MAG: hypothetical protein M1825_000909 [Sarcosagium campestre]|nr:MAG: hypothetical protein M1825_000909 [Sarcosagium campestre]
MSHRGPRNGQAPLEFSPQGNVYSNGSGTMSNGIGESQVSPIDEEWVSKSGGKLDTSEVEPSDAGVRNFPVYDRLDEWFGGRYDLQFVALSIMYLSEVGMLIPFRILHLSGSTGLIISYAMMGIVVAAVMSCIAEMVSLIPEPGALALFPSRFIDPSLGLAVGVSYWFTYAVGLATLTTATTIISTYWSGDIIQLDIGWRITIFLIIIIAINIFGVKPYGEVEHFFGWLKLIMLLGLTICSLAISCGANKDHKYYGTTYWRDNYKMPPNYGGHEDLSGGPGKFLAVWYDGEPSSNSPIVALTTHLLIRKSMTIAAFAYVGVEIVAVTAGEAKYPKRDIPFATKYVWLITICLYVFSVIFVSLCVPWDSKKLLTLGDSKYKNTGAVSPFIIALDEAGVAVLPGLSNAGFLFAAWTAANTALYVSSRTLYGMCKGMTPADNPILWPLGRTRKKNGAPTMAILVSCLFAPLAYLLCSTQNSQKLVDVFSKMGTIGCLMTWGCQCLAFLRFYFGLKYSIHDRSSPNYPYQSIGQPFTALFGLLACSLLVIFNGWDVFYNKPFVVEDLFAAYLWPVVFAVIYCTHKFFTKSEMKRLKDLDYYSSFGARDEPPPPSKGPIRNLFEFERPRPRRNKDLFPDAATVSERTMV